MATDPDDIDPGQLVPAESMQKWTDSIREMQQLTPGLAGRGSQLTVQSCGTGWTRLQLATTEYNGTGLAVEPTGIVIPVSGYYQVFGTIGGSRTSANSGTTPSRRGIGATTDPTKDPANTGMSRLQQTQAVYAVPVDGVIPILQLADELWCPAGAKVGLWFYQDTNATVDVAYRKITVRRVG